MMYVAAGYNQLNGLGGGHLSHAAVTGPFVGSSGVWPGSQWAEQEAGHSGVATATRQHRDMADMYSLLDAADLGTMFSYQ